MIQETNSGAGGQASLSEGTPAQHYNGAGLTDDGRLLSLEEIVAEWDMNMTIVYDYSLDEKELQPGKDRAIQNVYWHRKWIPLIMAGDGDAICVDLIPGPAGQQGQMILFIQGTMSRLVIATSWQRYLARFADGLEAGHYALNEYGEVACREGFEENRAIGSN